MGKEIAYYILASFKWLLSSGLTYLVLFGGIAIWTAKLVKVRELKDSSAYMQVIFRLSLCLLPLIITTVGYRYTYFLSNLITKTPEGAYQVIEESIQPYLSIGLGALTSMIFLWFFIFKPEKPNQNPKENQ